jgi:hypothetical protein
MPEPTVQFPSPNPDLSQSSGFTFGLEEAENIVFADYKGILSVFAALHRILQGCQDSKLEAVEIFGRPEMLERGKNRTWALDVADNASGGIVHELDSNLGNTSTGT